MRCGGSYENTDKKISRPDRLNLTRLYTRSEGDVLKNLFILYLLLHDIYSLVHAVDARENERFSALKVPYRKTNE